MDIQGRVVDWDCMSGRSELTRGLKALTLLVLDPSIFAVAGLLTPYLEIPLCKAYLRCLTVASKPQTKASFATSTAFAEATGMYRD